MAIGAGFLLITVFEKGKNLLFFYLIKATERKANWNQRVKKVEEQADILQDGAKKLYHKKHCLFLAFFSESRQIFFLVPDAVCAVRG